MEVTDVRIFLTGEEKLKAFVAIVFDQCFVVSDIKIIQGQNGRFISMPSKKRKNGTFKDIAHPLNSEVRKKLEEVIFRHYDAAVAAGAVPSPPDGDDLSDASDSEPALSARPSGLDARKYLP